MNALLKGALAGLAYGLLFGPLFFAGLRIVLTQGMRHGVALVGGAFASDVILATGGWWGANQVANLVRTELFQSVFGVASALLLFGFGLSAVLPKRKKVLEEEAAAAEAIASKRRFTFAQGFVLNMVNPSNWLFWLGLATAASADALADGNQRNSGLFLLAALTVLLASDLFKIFLANRIGQRLKPNWVQNIVRVAGLILMAVGIGILIKVIS